MRWWMGPAAAGLLALAAAPALAQGGLADPEGHVVSELVVQAREPGPAWWRVVDGDRTVYILGTAVDPLPEGVTWDRRWADKRIAGANTIIVGTKVNLTGGLGDIPALLRVRSKLRTKVPLEETLPEPLKDRFVAARERLGQPAGRYEHWGPMMAGAFLMQDAGKGRRRTPVLDSILREARRQHVKETDPARYKAMPFVNAAMASLTPALEEECLGDALADVEAPPARTRAAAEGWAQGDVRAALAEPRAFEKCLLLLGGGAELWRRMVDDEAGAIAAALKQPGHSVAVVGLRQLIAEGGVVDALEARGLKVLGPGEAE